MKTLNLFSGCGGCSLGLKQAGINVDLAVDMDEDACNTYSANLGHGMVWCTDLSKIRPTELLERAKLKRDDIALIVGGPPCQGFSSAGAKDWADPRNVLIRNFVDTVTTLKPTWFIMENVEGLLTANDGVFLIEAVTQFLNAGYWVRTKKLYMERYGIPQRRKRVFIVGNLEHCNFDFPEQTHSEQPTLFNIEQQLPLIKILDAIDDLPPPSQTGEVSYHKAPQNDYQRHIRRSDNSPITHHQIKMLNEIAQRRVAFLKQGNTMKHLPKELQHSSFTRRSYRRVMDGTPTESRGGAPSGLKRLIAHEPSLTITSGSPSEFIHPIDNRPLTLRECARLQSFPDWYEFQGSTTSIATQIGNAIPPMFMEVLVRHIQTFATWHRAENSLGRWLGIDATKSSGKSPILIKVLYELQERTNAFSYA